MSKATYANHGSVTSKAIAVASAASSPTGGPPRLTASEGTGGTLNVSRHNANTPTGTIVSISATGPLLMNASPMHMPAPMQPIHTRPRNIQSARNPLAKTTNRASITSVVAMRENRMKA